MSDLSVYHFTDTARLPWILQSGELRAGANRIGGFPSPDFLWATTNRTSARSASAIAQADGYREGHVLLVRFTLAAQDFEPWSVVHPRHPAWTPKLVALLERSGKGDLPADWLCRVDPLPRSHWLGIAVRSWRDNRWRPVPDSVKPAGTLTHDGAQCMSVALGEYVYMSVQHDGGKGQVGYSFQRVPAETALS